MSRRSSRAFIWGCAVLALAGMQGAANAASFDCAKAGTRTEKAICADPAVSRMDEDMATAFKAAMEAWPAGNWKDFLRREQRDWIKTRDSECKADAACLKRDYELRIAFLKRGHLKYMGRYVEGKCPADGLYLDATPRYPQDGVSVDLYVCPNPKGNMFLQAEGTVNAAGELAFTDAGCARTLKFTQDTATLLGSEAGKCSLPFKGRVFKRNAAKSPYEQEQ